MSWPFGALTPMKYGVILADPPWSFENYSVKGEWKSPKRHYACMPLVDIKALPVHLLAGPDCALVMWACAPLMDAALDTMKAWGFRFKTMGTWAKQSRTGEKWAFGTGYIFRSAAEFYILGTIGEPQCAVRNVRNLIVAPQREHSRKPAELHRNLERMYPHAWRAELFGRQPRPNWEVWGNDTTRFGVDSGATLEEHTRHGAAITA